MFRFRKNFISIPKPGDILSFNLGTEVDSVGVEFHSLAYKVDHSIILLGDSNVIESTDPDIEVSSLMPSDLPKYTDYKLSNLINAGVPLNVINTEGLISSSPTDSDLENVNAFLDKANTQSDDTEHINENL